MSRDVLAQHCYYCCSNKVMFLRFMGPCIVRIFQYISNQMQLFFLWRCDPTRVMASSFLRFLDHTQRRTTVGRTLLNEWSARRRDLYLTTHNTHNRQTSMPCVGFEPTISTDERPQTYALDRTATGTSGCNITQFILFGNCSTCFGWYHHPSSGEQRTLSTASGICHIGVTNTRCCR